MNEQEKKAIETIGAFDLANIVQIITQGEFEDVKKAHKVILNLIEEQEQTSHYIQSQLDIANAKIIEQAKEIEERRKQLETEKHNFDELTKELGKIKEERDMYRQQVNSAFYRGWIYT